MARILIVDPTATHAGKLKAVLQGRKHRVTEIVLERLSSALIQILAQFDVVIVDMTRDRREDWQLLRRVCYGRPLDRDTPRILAICAVYRGPRPRLDAERLGCRWLYVG